MQNAFRKRCDDALIYYVVLMIVLHYHNTENRQYYETRTKV